MPHRPARGSKRSACRIQYHCNQAGEGPPCRKQNWSQPQQQSHGLALRDRRHLAVTGVSRVISCDESAAVLETPLGNLTVGGQELQIGELSTQSGQVQISGRIEYLQYAENQQSGGGLLARLFR